MNVTLKSRLAARAELLSAGPASMITDRGRIGAVNLSAGNDYPPPIITSRNALLTGLPRSGTTLTCELLNRLPDTVALDEPLPVDVLTEGAEGEDAGDLAGATEHAALDPALVCDRIERLIDDMRKSLREGRGVVSKHVGGQAFGGKVGDDFGSDGTRAKLVDRGRIEVDKALTPSFLLLVKHPALFTALLDTLVARFPVFAIVRNPLAIMSSWQTVPFAVRDGRLPVAERIDRSLATALAGAGDRVGRQITLVSWFFDKYRDQLPPPNVIRYESIVESGGAALGVIASGASQLDQPLESRNRVAVYDPDEARELGRRLLETDGAYWDFYSREDVRALMETGTPRAG